MRTSYVVVVSMSVEGRLVRVCDSNPNLVAFVTLGADQKVCKNALVLVAGMTEGLMSLAYSERLSRALLAPDYSLVMVNLSSSWSQFGFRSLATDCEELERHISFLKTRFGFRNIALLGHSTGAQDALFFVRRGKPEITCLVNAIILQSPVSDREALTMEPYASKIPSMREEAERFVLEDAGERVLSEALFGVPITANRLLSLTGRLTDDDMFSTDLTESELDPILSSVKVPILLCFSENDEYVPDKAAQKELAQRMVNVLKRYSSDVQCKYFAGNHGLSEEHFYEPFIDCVVQFLSQM